VGVGERESDREKVRERSDFGERGEKGKLLVRERV